MAKKAWEDLTISDDFLFAKLMRDKEICKEIIEVLLEIEIDHIDYAEEEKAIKMGYDAKSIRLDVYVKGDDKIYNIEMQVTDYRNLPKRSRYYQSMIDLNTIEKGHNYKELPESYVIFICTFDPFQAGFPKYYFENVCRQDSALKLQDETYKVFFNTTAYGLEKNANIKAFLQYVNGEKTDNSFIDKIDGKIQTVKENMEWRVEYMTLLMREQEIAEENFNLAKEQGICNMVASLRRFQVATESIVEELMNTYQLTKEEAQKYC